MIFFEAPPANPLVEIVIEIHEKQTKEEKEPEVKAVTWRDNPQGCDEATEHIAAEEPFYCIPKPTESVLDDNTTTPSQIKKPVKTSSVAPSGYYQWGWCTYGAWSLTGWAGAWGDAKYWDDNARRDGHTVSSVPIVGSIFVDNSGVYGHVGVVIAVKGSTVTVKDMNYSGFGKWSVRTVPASRFVYIYP